jgi:hypothetical protein
MSSTPSNKTPGNEPGKAVAEYDGCSVVVAWVAFTAFPLLSAHVETPVAIVNATGYDGWY